MLTLTRAAPSVTYGARTSRILSHGKPANHVLAMTSPTPFLPSRVGAALISDVKNLPKGMTEPKQQKRHTATPKYNPEKNPRTRPKHNNVTAIPP